MAKLTVKRSGGRRTPLGEDWREIYIHEEGRGTIVFICQREVEDGNVYVEVRLPTKKLKEKTNERSSQEIIEELKRLKRTADEG